MNHARAESILNGLTSMANKVYEYVPIAEAWTFQQITNELNRNGLAYDAHRTRGCLRSLVDAGLIREAPPGSYQREKIREVERPMLQTVKPAHKTDTLGDIGKIASNLRRQAADLVATADALETLALDIAADVERSGEDSAQLRQLRSLLQGVIGK